ncbi:MAG: hypothetical protein ACD_76C00145G0006 [uncultured bacterium]|nr:MAG: hypothetical protein ACD_76C00145G0006 [uncultured bacterium]
MQLREHELGRNNIARKEQEVINKRFAALTGTVAEPIAPSAPVGSRVSASMGVLDEQDAHAKKIEPAVLQNAIDKSSVQTASVPVLSAQSIAENIGKRPSVTDVKAPKKLVGPIEELKMMNIERFRRLSSDPKEAGIKILDKIGLLAAESPIRKIEAIRAWGQSELYQSYLSSQKAALFGTDDQSGLIQQEKQAIFELNSELNS